jgi:predicted nucleotide-binding protein
MGYPFRLRGLHRRAEAIRPPTGIVYGDDIECREQLELLLRRMKLEPVILQKFANRW